MKGRLLVKGASVVYLEGTPFVTKALDEIDLSVSPGELIGLVGGTGSGKSTLVQAINGLVPLASGDIEYPDGYVSDRLFERIGLVFQQPEDQLFERTVAEDVAFGPTQLGLDESLIRKRVTDAVTAMGLEPRDYLDKNPLELSGGEKRRVAIAGILSMDPEFLILDEPTAGLDQAGRQLLLSSIRRLHKTRGLTLLVVSHDMELLGKLVDRIVILQKGKVAADGKPEQVFQDIDLLSGAGLRPPVAIETACRLRAAGLKIDSISDDPLETARVIARAFKARGKAG